jgi:L-ascorbate metabolism protein UlaG (beta-lactamase superfamily)
MAATERAYGSRSFEEDEIRTSGGPLVVTAIGHGSLMLTWQGLVVHVDPVSTEARYEDLPPAAVILVTHDHGDHFDPAAIELLRRPDTEILLTEAAFAKIRGTGAATGARIVRNGDRLVARGLAVEAVAAYNIRHLRSAGTPFHPRGEGNGYLVTFADKKVYIAGDTEDTPEMRALRGVDVAFVPMNLPYTMTARMVAEAARAFVPRVLYPYHTGDTDVSELERLLSDVPEVEVRLRRLV